MARKKHTQEEAEKRSLDIGVRMIGKYNGINTNTEFECPFCLKIFKARPDSIWDKHTTSCGCMHYHPSVYIKRKMPKRITQKEAEEKSLSVGVCMTGKYLGTLTKTEFKCPFCGEIMMVKPNSIWTRSTKSCGCLISNGENKISEILKKYLVDFEKQKRFKDCRDKNPLPFDFYITSYKMCIEYQGRQHFEKKDYSWTRCEEEEERRLKSQQNRDKIKREFCKKNNLKLLEIKYTDYSRIEEILIRELEYA